MYLKNLNSFLTNSSYYEQGLLTSDLIERDNQFIFILDVPGFKKDEISISFKHGYMTVIAAKEVKLDKDARFLINERTNSVSKRSFYVGKHYQTDDFKAKVEDGVLTITLTKNKEDEGDKTIAIE
ncbi:MAG: Hsp20/alpha crystallin family protein [Erysipelotrichaceae bacterium]|nr:Hsp20/alpha crystallin family protein [Erysipelotrichaceae bacterium]